jgi:hypothetical protein
MRDADGIRSEGQLFTVPAAGGPATALPMPTSGAGDYAPDGKRIVYSPLFRDFRTWKRYQGGWAEDLFVYDLATAALSPARPPGTCAGRRPTTSPASCTRRTASCTCST